MSYIVPNPSAIKLGQYHGDNQQCVSLVKKWGNAPATSTWNRGASAKNHATIATGTCIATFDADGHYTNTPGTSHAAVYLSQDASGLLVIDQWAGQTAHKRSLRFGAAGDSNNGDLFYIIE